MDAGYADVGTSLDDSRVYVGIRLRKENARYHYQGVRQVN